MLLRFAYQHPPGMSWIDALYFSTETIATVGYGDFSFMRPADVAADLFGIGLMFAGVTTTAILVAFIADVLLSRRMAQSAGRRQGAAPAPPRHRRRPRLVRHPGGQRSEGRRATTSRSSSATTTTAICPRPRELDVPVIFGDATLRQTLESARIDEARAVAVLTQDDMVNIETGIVLHEMLGPRTLPEVNRPDVPIVLRVYDRTLGAAVAQRFGFENVRSTVESGGAVVHRRRDGAAGARHVLGGPALVHGRRRVRRSRAASSTGCGWSTCPPRPGSSRSPGPGRRCGCIRGATPG